ncbi:anion permease [Bombilactobacillus folatiphilus]|uniref:Anion permease n=1 Tax=Bombilactobacillus folatiphilus TaxID=2923362 RepID=A0ABY4P844_9LACO|nr:SLC13 family permease [Bombilactobacillus folatiphilus]UQS81873.1 anion permease [Bombilactobacillus folatiphilus]
MVVLKNILLDKMLWIAAGAAVISTFVSKPQLSDINFQTIFSLMSMMILVQILENIGLLQFVSTRLTAKAHNTCQLMTALVLLAFFGSMFITNDVAILILAPLFFKIASEIPLSRALTMTMITIAANLGSSFTPFGNPHNLFLLSHFNLNALTFFKMSTPLMLIELVLLILTTNLLAKPKPINIKVTPFEINLGSLIVALFLTIFIFLGIFKIVPIWWTTVAAAILACIIDPHILKKVDYTTLLVFVCFFIAVGNISRFPAVANLISRLVAKPISTYLTSIGFCQLISNVPTTILVAKFTKHFYALFLGSNIGGLGTLVASMANLLAYKQYVFFTRKKEALHFIKISFQVNLLLLVILGCIGLVLVKLV